MKHLLGFLFLFFYSKLLIAEPKEQILKFNDLPYSTSGRTIVLDTNDVELGIILSQSETGLRILTQKSFIVSLDYLGTVETEPLNGQRLYAESNCKGPEYFSYFLPKGFYPKILIKNFEMDQYYIPALEGNILRVKALTFKSGREGRKSRNKNCENYPKTDKKGESYNIFATAGFKIRPATLEDVGLPPKIIGPLKFKINP